MTDDKNKGNNGKNMSTNDSTDYNPNRRRFIKNTGMVVGGLAGGSLLLI